MFILLTVDQVPRVANSVMTRCRHGSQRSCQPKKAESYTSTSSTVTSRPLCAIQLPIQPKDEPINRAERLGFYVEEMKAINDIDLLVSILCDTDEVLSCIAKELFPDTFRVSFLTDSGKHTKPIVLPLYKLLEVSAAINKHEDNRVEFNFRAAALFRLNDLLVKDSTIRFTSGQIEKLVNFKANSKEIIGDITEQELFILNHFLDQLISRGPVPIAS